MSIPTAECIRYTALVESKVHSLATCRSVTRRKGCKMGVLTREPRRCPHPGAEGVSSPRSREGVLTRVSRGCPHPKVYWVSSPKSACRKFDLLRSKSYQGNLAAPDEEVVVLHLPLRGHCTIDPRCRTSRLSSFVWCLSCKALQCTRTRFRRRTLK